MALLITYLMYTNSYIAYLADFWLHQGRSFSELVEHAASESHDATLQNPWIRALNPKVIMLGCCCCSWSQQYLYNRNDLLVLLRTAKSCETGDVELTEPAVQHIMYQHRTVANEFGGSEMSLILGSSSLQCPGGRGGSVRTVYS